MLRGLLPLALVLVTAGAASAGPFTIFEVVDTSTPVPGEASDFDFLQLPAADGAGGVAFRGGAASLMLWFASGGSIEKIADPDTVMPGSDPETTFTDFPPTTITAEAGRVAFGAAGRPLQNGLYSWEAGALTTIVDTRTSVPGLASGLGFYWMAPDGEEGPHLSNGHVAFSHDGSAYAVTPGGGIRVIADDATDLPGGPWGPRQVTGIDRDGTVLVWGVGSSGRQALFAWNDGTFTRLADQTTPIPGGTGDFVHLGSGLGMSDLDLGVLVHYGVGENLVEAGLTRRQEGIYRLDDGTHEAVITNSDPVPGMPGYRFVQRSATGGLLQSIQALAYHDGVLAFHAAVDEDDIDGNGNEKHAIFAEFEGTLVKLVCAGDLLDGKVIRFLELAQNATRNGEIAFTALFDDGSRGIYLARLAEIPEPTTLALLGLGLTGLAGVARRRRSPV